MKEKQSPKSGASKYSPKRLILMAFGALTGLAAIGVLVALRNTARRMPQ